MKRYITPEIRIINDLTNKMICSSKGCTCGCCNNPDGSNIGGGCWGCPSCNHDNQGNHNCNQSKNEEIISWDDDEDEE